MGGNVPYYVSKTKKMYFWLFFCNSGRKKEAAPQKKQS